MSILFVRHGQSQANIDGLCSGQLCQTELSALGRYQAKYIGQVLAAKKIMPDVIFDTDLPRSRETARIIADTIGYGAAIPSLPEWRERHFGEWEGQRYEPFIPLMDAGEAPPGGESETALWERLETGLRTLLGLQQKVLIVSHGGTWHHLHLMKGKKDAPYMHNANAYKLLFSGGDFSSLALHDRPIQKG